ncbi:transcriptional regulator, Cro/CI family [Desulfocucumis palustris]|uniref:Transcriptional regulator, Cro/CI family n=1 Tax=Desulfocucumis palustris TaxID=1898651 RepID=A0A2L2XH99_9FIRM|nr:helix-turn-helix transcriptional regulator [Desulfocucumis palustris]GBF35502.1 transcriptional regulator, Cro/CI family [Desulfocucumis palustris]
MNLGNRLKKARMKRGLTQIQAAQILGIANTALSNYERGERDPDTTLLKRLSELYGVSADHLLNININSKIDIMELLEDGNTEVDIEGRPLTLEQRLKIKYFLSGLLRVEQRNSKPEDVKYLENNFSDTNLDRQLDRAVIAASHESRQFLQASPDLRELIKEEVVKILEERKSK